MAVNKHQVLIRPEDFTRQQWTELYYVSMLIPRAWAQHHKAAPFKAPVYQIRLAIAHCNAKARAIAAGELGPDAMGQDAQWRKELRGAAKVLSNYIRGEQ